MFLSDVTDPSNWTSFIERVGVPTFVLILVLIYGFKLVIRPLVDSHREMIAQLKTSNSLNSDNLTKLTELMEQHIDTEEKRISSLETRIESISEQLKNGGG